jgi:hypothetical protein
MAEMKVHCAFVKGGKRSVILTGGTIWYIFDWKSRNKHSFPVAKVSKGTELSSRRFKLENER